MVTYKYVCYETTPYKGRYDAMPLILSLGNNSGNFALYCHCLQSFNAIKGEIRNIKLIQLANGHKALIVAINNGRIILLQSP